MKLLVLSDLHLECADLSLPAQLDFDVALLAGDIAGPAGRGVQWVRDCPVLQRARAVVMVPGNHEYYDGRLPAAALQMKQQARQFDRPELHVLDGDALVIDGVRFLGCTLWTDFGLRIDSEGGAVSDPQRGMAAATSGMADYRAIEADLAAEAAPRKLTTQDTLALHRLQRAWLEQALAVPFDGRTVVVTHHGPHRRSLAQRFAADWVSTAFINELPAPFFETPSLWVHGHTHTSFDYRLGNCRVVCNPRGYTLASDARPENPRFDPGCVVELR